MKPKMKTSEPTSLYTADGRIIWRAHVWIDGKYSTNTFGSKAEARGWVPRSARNKENT